MGNSSIKPSTKKKNHFYCCCCCFNSSHSLCSITNDEKSYPAFDRIISNHKQHSTLANVSDVKHDRASKKRIYYCQSIEDLQKSVHDTASIDQWIDSLPILGTPVLYHLQTKPVECQLSQEKDNEAFEQLLTIKSNREFSNLTKKFHLTLYLKDYLNRVKHSHVKQTFNSHFSSSKIIYPCNGTGQVLVNDLHLLFTTPSESILPTLLINTNSSYKIHEQMRSKCYFVPLTNCKIEPDDDEYKQKSILTDRTHVVITLENNKLPKVPKIPMESKPSFIFTSNDSFHAGFIRIDEENMPKEYLSFIFYCSEENVSYLSSSLIQQWFNTLIFVNQTCAIVNRFLTGDGTHITCLLKEQMKQPSDKENVFSNENSLLFTSLRLPSSPSYVTDSFSSTNHQDGNSEKIIDAFSPVFLSNNKQVSSDTIHIDYEQYSIGFLLCRWPKPLIESYYTHPNRYSKRQWPSKYHMNILTNKSLLLTPDGNTHRWKIKYDLIEDRLFELMDQSTLYLYALCQQLFAPTYAIRVLIKHCFLNYCEKYGLPFSNDQNNLHDVITRFLKELSEKITKKFIPNYFNHQINLLNSNENYNQWFDYIHQCLHDRLYLTSSPVNCSSNRSIIIEFLFHFIDQLYRTFHFKRSEFCLNDSILLDLHRQLCEKLSNGCHNNHRILFAKLIDELLNNKQIIDEIQKKLTGEFETNAELVHKCLNQIRKAQTSLIFHYTWTIYIQYLHTYYNVLWNMESLEIA